MKKLLLLPLMAICLLSFLPIPNGNAQSNILLPAEKYNSNGELKWGYINNGGKFVIEPKYDYVQDFNSKGIAIAIINSTEKGSINSNAYFIDTLGKIVLGPLTSNESSIYNLNFTNGYAFIYDNVRGSTLINDIGKVVLKTMYRIEGVSEDIISISEKQGNSTKYGYMDIQGKILIAPKFLSAYNFKNGQALVEPALGKYNLIDKTAKILEVSDSVNKLSNENSDIYPFLDDTKKKYGYMDKNGEILITPQFDEADDFIDGTAIVAVYIKDGESKKGLIDAAGNYVIKPEYTNIYSLGNNLYGVSNEGYEWNYSYCPYAVFDSTGKKLSDFIYYNIQPFIGDYASACSNTQTFFIDKEGKIAEDLPKLQGIGTMELDKDIITANVGETHSYLKSDGISIWKQDNLKYSFPNGIQIRSHRYIPDLYTSIEYPEVLGIADKKVQDKINNELKKLFIPIAQSTVNVDTEDDVGATDSINYSVRINNNLLMVEKTGEFYPLGAAHGMLTDYTYHIDLKTGSLYELKNIFKGNSKYLDKLKTLIVKQIQLNLRIKDESLSFYYFDENPTISPDISFTINKDCLTLSFAPYEISSFAAGFISFNIPYGQIIDIIDAKGAFWNSFNKEVTKSKINLIGDVYEDTSLKIQSLMKNYETQIIDAINLNNFKKVEPTLFKDSNLYTSQKKLVSDLYKKGTKEKLESYEIYAIGYSYDEDSYKVYVFENIAIKTPPAKAYTSKKFSWCYTIKPDNITKSFKLTKIEKW
jgi:hypothetical protein